MKKDKLYTVGSFSREYIAANTTNTALKELQINTFIKDLYDEIVDEVLLNNYEITVARMYVVSMRRVERTFDKLAINWKESLKLKKEALAEGKKLATKIGISDKGNPIFDDGVQWMVYFTDPYYSRMVPRPKGYRIDSGEFVFPKVRFLWQVKQNSRLLIRLSRYIQDNKVSILNLPLYYGSENNFL